MSYLTLFLTFLAISCTTAILTRDDDNATRVIKGYYPPQETVGFTVGVMLHFEKETGWCGGVLISDRYVLSSAHCLRKAPASTVLLNANDINKIGEVIPVVQMLIHPKFGKTSYKNDLAILRLQRPAKISDLVYPIRLPKKSEKKKSFKKAQAVTAGWGRDGNTKVVPGQRLTAVNAKVISNFDCWWSYPAYIGDKNICTSSKKGMPCEGDDGGPLFITEDDGEPTLIGVTSYQFSLGCTSLWPAAYTRISYFLDWICDNSDVEIRN